MTATETTSATPTTAPAASSVTPKRIVNAQTVCNERNEKGKLCNGHLKQLRTAGESSQIHLRGDDVLSKCQTCGALYMGPPLGHVRDPYKQTRFVEAELSALLQAGAFFVFFGGYILEPSLETPKALAAPENQRLLACLPSYWFLGLFHELNGTPFAPFGPLTARALGADGEANVPTCFL